MTVLEEEVKASDLLVFIIDDIRYGLPANEVVELTRAVAIQALPHSLSNLKMTKDSSAAHSLAAHSLAAHSLAAHSLATDFLATNFLEGIVNFHGELAAAINLRSRFGHRDRALHPSEHFIFTRAGKHLVALRADRVMEIIHAPVEALDIMTSPLEKSEQGQSFAGVSKLSDGLVFIFDLQNFLSNAEALVLDQHLAQNLKSGEDHN